MTSPLRIFRIFLRLGCTSFGGPTAHLGYFRDEFVEKRKWFSDKQYADLVALCQFLPGPASSQVGMAIGLQRAGYLGMFLAWVGFTLPSVLLMVAFALGVAQLGDISEAGWLLGLKAAAVAVVAQAVYGMTKNLVTGKIHAAIAVAALVLVLLVPHPLIQVGAIVLGIVAGLAFLRVKKEADDQPQAESGSRTFGIVCLVLFFALLFVLPLVARLIGTTGADIFDTFYRAGALVFGGGHVVLPLLEAVTVGPGLVDHDTFLAGYGAAQAMPGPLFTFASYLGTTAQGVNWVMGAMIATIAIFLPAALLVLGAMPFWERIRRMPRAGAALAGANAAVVGILGAALYTPVFTAGITGVATLSIAVVCFAALTSWKVPPWAVVIGAALVGWVVL
ncbi:chromate efflux transporter [Corynebacterium sp. p3-SID1145]|uniref:chromate efflux transporter n=1 Tax=unclassified Corynebacterium TaxID=2624378 RepID=UPI0021AA9E62|nr:MULTISPECIES: chromate efflux transporter [unclassified Corynebacterium]MCT1453271.1 chromate efflux transporter [Corynebacterium sp. p3-SID1145]MCT1462333.1 chromate efflux transporter [Corynebacterium sp. p3-SID1140]